MTPRSELMRRLNQYAEMSKSALANTAALKQATQIFRRPSLDGQRHQNAEQYLHTQAYILQQFVEVALGNIHPLLLEAHNIDIATLLTSERIQQCALRTVTTVIDDENVHIRFSHPGSEDWHRVSTTIEDAPHTILNVIEHILDTDIDQRIMYIAAFVARRLFQPSTYTSPYRTTLEVRKIPAPYYSPPSTKRVSTTEMVALGLHALSVLMQVRLLGRRPLSTAAPKIEIFTDYKMVDYVMNDPFVTKATMAHPDSRSPYARLQLNITVKHLQYDKKLRTMIQRLNTLSNDNAIIDWIQQQISAIQHNVI